MEAVTVLPILAVSSVVGLIIIKLYQVIRVKLPKRVNCWFCNKNTFVPYIYKDSWKCPSCEQYNGFTSNGDYNRVLLAQYNVTLNKTVLRPMNKPMPAKNELCQFCNINQELKVAQLAAFVPIEPSNFDAEVDVYREELDKAYRLCNRCDTVVSEKLLKQQSWLKTLYNDIESFVHKKIEPLNQVKSRSFFYAYITAIVSAALFLLAANRFQLSKEIVNYSVSCLQLLTNLYPLPEYFLLLNISDKLNNLWFSLEDLPLILTGLGTALQLLEAFEEQNVSAALSVITWLILTVLSTLSTHDLGLVSIVEMLVGGFTFFINIMHIKDLKLARLRAAQSFFKKSNVSTHVSPSAHGVETVSDTNTNRPKSPFIPVSKAPQSPTQSNKFTPTSFKVSQGTTQSHNFSPASFKVSEAPTQSHNFDTTSFKVSKAPPTQSHNFDTTSFKVSQGPTQSHNFSPTSSVTNANISQSFINHNFGLNSLQKSSFPEDLGLSKLNLGAQKNHGQQHSAFETRSYGSKVSGNLFRPVLTPPKLCVESLYSDIQTRSSSQSSGFCSSASQRCDTRPPSVVGDFDTASNDGCSVSPYSRHMYNSLYQYPIDPMYPVPPYFHFAAQYHRMYQAVPTPALHSSLYNSSKTDSKIGLKNILCSMLVISNLALIWIVIYKDLLR